ncbi:MAG TPA: hypothetical protein VII99_13570 [Bacteroidia bacterium]
MKLNSKPKDNDPYYHTECELRFIIGLGKYTKSHGMSRLDLLLKYQEASNKRERWDCIDELVIAEAVEVAIQAERKIQKDLKAVK